MRNSLKSNREHHSIMNNCAYTKFLTIKLKKKQCFLDTSLNSLCNILKIKLSKTKFKISTVSANSRFFRYGNIRIYNTRNII